MITIPATENYPKDPILLFSTDIFVNINNSFVWLHPSELLRTSYQPVQTSSLTGSVEIMPRATSTINLFDEHSVPNHHELEYRQVECSSSVQSTRAYFEKTDDILYVKPSHSNTPEVEHNICYNQSRQPTARPHRILITHQKPETLTPTNERSPQVEYEFVKSESIFFLLWMATACLSVSSLTGQNMIFRGEIACSSWKYQTVSRIYGSHVSCGTITMNCLQC